MSAAHPLRRATDLPTLAGQMLNAHEPIVAQPALETKGNTAADALETDVNSQARAFPPAVLAEAICTALDLCGLAHKEAAEQMDLTPAQWSKQLRGVDGHHISLPRLMVLGESFRRHLWRLLAQRDGLTVSHPDFVDALLLQAVALIETAGQLSVQIRRSMRRAG